MLRKAILKAMWWLLKLRYRVVIQGEELLQDPRFVDKGVLILPNHTAEMEPFVMMALLERRWNTVPLVVENFYQYAKEAMNIVGARPVPEFDTAVNSYKLKTAETLFQEVVADLEAKKAILLYPSSGLKVSGVERVGGRSLAHSLVQAVPETEVLLVRITGFWGSMFSKAYTEKTPDFWKTFLRGVGILLKNGIFFAPRRTITIELSTLPKEFPKQGSRLEFNKALEAFYNQYPGEGGERLEEEPLQQTPLYFWSKRVHEGSRPIPRGRVYHDVAVPLQIRQDILFQISEMSEWSVKHIHDHSDLIYDLGLDSLNIASLYTHLDTHYELDKDLKPGDLKSVQDLFAAAMKLKIGAPPSKEEGDAESMWPKAHKRRPNPVHAEGDTIIEAFLRKADTMKSFPIMADAVSGVIDYQTAKRAIVILAKEIEALEGTYIGVMLPSSNGAYLVMLAIMLAGKVAVPLNWTVGSFFLNHAVDLMDIQHVITSEKFLKRLDNVDIGKVLDRLVTVEKIRGDLTWQDKIKGALLAKKSAKKILQAFGAREKKGEDTAFVLFTSGTTALPKAVPLTHKNILVNQKDVLGAVDLYGDDVIMVPLPPFHIYGLNVGLLGILMGMRTVYSPDPLDGSQIAKEILKWKVSVVIMAPTFFSHLFRSATLSQLKSVRMCVSGAEKAPPTLMEFVQKLGSVLWIEGYGLTETSPMIAVNTSRARPRGVGKIIPSIDLVIRDPETGVKLGVHQVGEVCVRGDTVFDGYYRQDKKEAFIDIDGKLYYKTGDLGYYDEDRYLHLEGRLKLTFKRGGEMINLVAIEKALFDKAKEKGWISPLANQSPFACAPKEVPQGATRAVLFSEINIAIDQINAALLEVGFSRLYKINEVIVVDELPLLKSGKVCYRKLFEMLKQPQSIQA